MTAQHVFKTVLALLCSAPLIWLAWLIVQEISNPTSALGADPGESVVHYLGEWSLAMLLFAFSVSPLRRVTGTGLWVRNRRLVGLFAFFYVLLHVLSYVFFYLEFSWSALLEDLIQRTYITVGMLAVLLLLPMAWTSTRGWQRKLGARWKQLHLLIYPAVGLALVHLWWLTREDYSQVVLFSLWFAVLCGERVWRMRPIAKTV